MVLRICAGGSKKHSNTDNDYRGTTTINGGTLRVGADEVISDDSDVVIGSGGALEVDGNNETIASLQGAGLRNNLIRDVTPIPHNGCRAPKRRRV